jgi:imidazolonepropionase-like amidohydrolase
LRVSGPVLPDGEPRDLYVVDGRITLEPQPGAETVASGWVVPGLVDAHCHIGLDEHGEVDQDATEAQALADRDAGALLLRDCGSPADTRWVQDRDDLPRLIRMGRHIARTRRYIRDYAHEVEPDDLTTYVEQEARRGDGWVKLVGDWIDREAGDLAPSFPADSFAEAIAVAHAHGARVTAHVVQEAQRGDGWVKLVGDWISREEGDLAPSFPPEAFAEAIAAAHEHGARVTAHCFGETVLPTLIEAGIDCIEHGTGLTLDLIDTMVERGTALVPTVVQLNNFPNYAEAGESRFPAYAATMRDLHARRRETIMAAYDAGVPIYAGTDAGGVLPHGGIAGEVLELHDYGFSAEQALGAASWRARDWLGWNGTLAEGAPADFVVYAEDPRADLGILRSPACVVLRGVVVA